MKNKKIIIIISAIVLALLIALVIFLKVNPSSTVETDREKLAKEYGWVDEKNKKTDNVFVYRTPEEIIKILKNGTGIVYLGFPECPWCCAYVKYLNEVAKDEGIEKIYNRSFNALTDEEKNKVYLNWSIMQPICKDEEKRIAEFNALINENSKVDKYYNIIFNA